MCRSIVVVAAAFVSLGAVPTARLHAQDNDKDWVTIKGRIVWSGKAPERKKITVNVDKAACLAKGDLLDEAFLVNPKNQGFADVFVWLASRDEENELPIHPKLKNVQLNKVEIDTLCCMFKPRVIAIREGQDLVARNSSMISHNFRVIGNPETNPGGGIILPAANEYKVWRLKAQKLPLLIECNIHPWMRGRIGVFKHPYFAVTDANGNFEMKMAPTGDHRLFIYHDASGWRGGKAGKDGQPLMLKGGQVMDLGDIVFNVKK